MMTSTLDDNDDFSEEEWEVQQWRVESYNQDCFLEEQRKKLQVNVNSVFWDIYCSVILCNRMRVRTIS